MHAKLGILTLTFLGGASLFAQDSDYIPNMPVRLGFKIGIPVTDMFSTSNNASIASGTQLVSGYSSGYTPAVPRYEFGVSGEFRLPYHLRFEVDGLFKRTGFATSTTSTAGISYIDTKANVWEIPGLIKYNIGTGHFRPFIDVGASLRHISSFKTNELLPGLPSGIIVDNSSALHNRNSFGGVAGFGITFKKGALELTPEARYTRWANESFQALGLRTNLDQGDVLLGITF